MARTLFAEDKQIESAALTRLIKTTDAKMWKSIHKMWKLEDTLRDVKNAIGWEAWDRFGQNPKTTEQIEKEKADNKSKRDKLTLEIARLQKEVDSYWSDICRFKNEQINLV